MPDSAIAPRPDVPDLIARYAAGETVPELAAESGVHRATLYRWMLAGSGDDQYHDLVTHALVQRVALADNDLRTARDACDITRARETARFARMDLERRRASLYGQKHEITQTVTVTIEQTLSADARALLQHVRGRVIEHEEAQDVVADDPVLPQQHDPFLAIT